MLEVHPHAARLALALVTLCLVSGFTECTPDGATRPGAACDGGVCSDAASPPPCVGESCGLPPGGRPDGPYACAPGVVCEAWQECLDGVCTGEPPTDECASHADCAGGAACVAGRCTGEMPGCLADADCAAGESCVSGTCTPGCASSADCAPGERCVAGTCGGTTDDDGCTADADCTGGEVCVGGVCGPAPTGGGGCLDEHCH